MELPNQVVLVPLAPGTVTAYIGGGRVRTSANQIPHLSDCVTVDRARGPGWMLAPSAASDYAALQADLIDSGAEPSRLTDANRPPSIQGPARQKFVRWVAAGRPRPGSSGYHEATMKTAFVAPLDESNHQWGGAVDIDVEALYWPDLERGSDEALGRFWEFAKKRGFTPIIANPHVGQSECWHFDHWGPLKGILAMFTKRKRTDGYKMAARAGCALAGSLDPNNHRSMEMYVQARLLIAGFWCGPVDGVLGLTTQGALKEAGCPADLADSAGLKAGLHPLTQWLSEQHLGSTAIAQL
jgi:hypothetical protein